MILLDNLQFATTAPDASLLYASFYDVRLVTVSILIAVFAAYTALDVAGRIGAAQRSRDRLLWLAIGSVAMGGGIWAMHFIGMLALTLPCGVTYDPFVTVISMVPGMLASAVALEVISRRRISGRRLAVGSVLLGGGIGAMHYSGMAAMRLDGFVRYDPTLFGISIVVAIVLAWLALWIRLGVRRSGQRHLIAAMVMGGAIAGMHYTAMAAAWFVRDGSAVSTGGLNPTWLAIAVTIGTGLLIALVLAATLAHRQFELARALTASEQKLRSMLDTTQEGFWMIDRHGTTQDINPALCAILGRSREEIVGHATFGFVDAANAEIFRRELRRRDTGEKSSFEVELLRPDGSLVPCLFNAAPLYDNNGSRIGSFALVTDVSSRRAQDAYQRQAVAVFENTEEAILITDPHGTMVSVNAAFTRVTGYSAEEAVGANPRLLGSGRHDTAFFEHMWAQIAATGSWQGELWNRRKNGEIYPEWLSINTVRDAAGKIQNYLGVFSDISHIKKSEADLQRLAHYDALTGLANRSLLGIQLSHAIDRAERDSETLGVLLLDLDGFKNVNDSLGHPAGDRLLQIVATRLKEVLRSADTVARLGGDEFAIVIESLDDAEGARLIAEKLIAAVAEPYNLRGKSARVTTSVGIALFPEDGADAIELLRAADTALYAAKREGRNTFRFHDAAMAAAVKSHMVLEQGLRHALVHHEFELWYQPQLSLGSGRVSGAEALLRWRHPQRGLLGPVDFIHVAYETGLIVTIGEWVLGEACRQAQRWHTAGLLAGRVSVNVDSRQIERGDFFDVVERVLAETGLSPQLLELEITESFLLANAEAGMGTVAGLRDIGVAVAIDDFGTGYSSLSYLKYLRADHLKIDRSFVRDLPDDVDDAAITRAIIVLARSLGFKVIAEGVETQEQEAFLRAEGCDDAQGYHYAKPLPVAEFEAWVKARNATL